MMWSGRIVMRGRVEIDEIACHDIDGADAEADRAGLSAIKIDQPFQRALQIVRVVKACCLDRCPVAETKEVSVADRKNPLAPPTVAKFALIWLISWRMASPFAKLETCIARARPWSIRAVTCVQKSRRRSIRVSGGLPARMAALMAPIDTPESVGMNACLAEGLVDTSLAAQGAPTLQHERHDFERKAPFCSAGIVRPCRNIHVSDLERSASRPAPGSRPQSDYQSARRAAC